MFAVVTGNAGQLPPGLEVALASYRHRVFIEALHWRIPCDPGLERDQFDRVDTLYVIAVDTSGSVCGCARLLPTTRPYLLGAVFPELMNGHPAPQSYDVWELSRFSTTPAYEPSAMSRGEARTRLRTLLGAVVEVAASQGASRLIMVTVLGAERILRALGVHVHRAGPPHLVDGKPTLAAWVELDDQTYQALQLSSQNLAKIKQ